MTEEEYFRKYYPNFCYGDKPLSPHWDFFQEGVEFGERESEEKIKDLEETIKELKEQLGNLYEIIKRPYQFTAPRKIQMVIGAERFLKEE